LLGIKFALSGFGLCHVIMANLCAELFRLYALGQLAATEVQSIVLAASKDGWGTDHPTSRKMIKSASSKNVKKNASRDVLLHAQAFLQIATHVQSYMVEIYPGCSVGVYLPHEILQHVAVRDGLQDYCLSPAELAAPDNKLAQLLREWRDHPDVNFQGPLEKVIVAGLHCDGVTYTSQTGAGQQKSVLVASLNVLSGIEKTRQLRFPLFVLQKTRLCKCGCGGFHTMEKLFIVMAWSFRMLLEGTNPTVRHDASDFTDYDTSARATPLADIVNAALLQVRGDWEGLMTFFRLRAPNQAEFCWKCEASNKPGVMHYSNFGPGAPHRATCFTHDDYIRRCVVESGQPSHIFRCPGFQLKHIVVDAMHAGDLGTFADALGSLFYLEMTCRLWHSTQAVGIVALNISLQQFYSRTPGLSRLGAVTKTRLVSKSHPYPYLHAKAAQTRHLSEFALELAYKHALGVPGPQGRPAFAFTEASPMAGKTQLHLDLMVKVFQGFERYCRSLNTVPFDGSMCSGALILYLQSMAALNSLWREGRSEDEAKRLPWHLRQKCHLMEHVALDHVPRFGSPAKSWCYRDEDYVGAVKRICSKTKHPATLEARVMLKLRLLEALRVMV
jgi:hypothetical protein